MKLKFRKATEADLPLLVQMLAEDDLGAQREDTSTPLNDSYVSAFARIDSDPNNELTVVELENEIVGMLQLTFIPYLTHIGSLRCLVEGVRIHKSFRGQGLGTQFFQWIVQQAREKGCDMIQLTSNKHREQAIRFYEKLGFEASHEGLKLSLGLCSDV